MAAHPPLEQSVAGLLGRRENRYVFLIGGGGKTTLLFALAHSLCRKGDFVITTTSTKILRPSPEDSPAVVVEGDIPRLTSRLHDRLGEVTHVTAANAALADGDKLAGFTADDLDQLYEARVADYLLVEADGAAGRSLKAHAEHEPVVSHRADLAIAVIGIDCLGKPLSDEHVHRAGRFGETLGCEPGTPITVDDVARIFFHPCGYLKAVGPQMEIAVFLSKVKSATDRECAAHLANALRQGDAAGRIARIAAGDLVGSSAFVEILKQSL